MMRNYPKIIATREDFENLLSMPEFHDQAIADLEALSLIDDEFATRVVSGSEEEGNLVTERIPNPLPIWKQRGFASRSDVADLRRRRRGRANGK